MSRKRILIVDDNEINRVVMQGMLQPEGYACHSAPDGQSALLAVPKFKPDLILLDIMMPGMDGFEVTRRLKDDAATKHIPIILLTALTDRDSRLKGLEAGAEDFLSKPVDRLELGMRARNLLRLKEYHDALYSQNRTLETEVEARARELTETRLEIVDSLARAAEFRDNETGFHIIRMSRYSKLLAKAWGMTDEQADLLMHAAPMHDIGKIGIPDEILLKPGKLTAVEWQLMKQHTVIGANILQVPKPSGLIVLARSIALSHHERWDGSGYPKGLAGEAIPIEARVVAVSDVFDALTSERPYKEAWPVDKAAAEIEAQRGRQFDPRIVDHFKELLPDILAIREQYLDEKPAGEVRERDIPSVTS